MKSKMNHIMFDRKQGIIYVAENHARVYSNFGVDTFRSNYNFTTDASRKTLDIFNQYRRFAKKGCFYSASQTYICSPRFPLLIFEEIFPLVMVIVKDKGSYVLITDGGRA